MTMQPTDSLDLARSAAAEHLRQTGFVEEAGTVARGDGDDFAEVRIALSLLRILGAGAVMPHSQRYARRTRGEEC